MTKQKVATALHYAGYIALGGVGLIAMYHPVILALLVVSAALFFFARKIERSD